MEARVFRATPALPLASLLAVVLITGCGGTGGGGTGDPPVEPKASLYGDCYRLSEIQGAASWFQPGNANSTGCKYPVDQHVCASGLTIVAIDQFDETGDGAVGNYYVEDTFVDPVPSSGITVFDPSFSPPDLRLAVGDVADVLGTFQEFPGPSSGRFDECKTLPEIGGAMTLRFEGSTVQPLPIKVAELVSYDTARPYIGMLVRLDDVTIFGTPSESSGRYTAPLKVTGFDEPIEADDVPKLSNELYDLASAGLDHGSALTSVTGIVTYFYGFKIAPRSPADLVP